VPTQAQKDKAGKADQARQACVARAKQGEFITNKIALKALEKAGARSTRITGNRKTTIAVAKKQWMAGAKKHKIDAEEVVAMLTDLGYPVTFTDAKKAGEAE
jgi:hypothetical protein